MTSAIQELLGKPACELTDEELMDLMRGNRPQIAAPKVQKQKTKHTDIEGLDLFDDPLNDPLNDFNLDDSEEE